MVHASLSPQLWRALRMIVDTGLHYKGLRRDEALHMFQKYLWDDSDIALKEVTRYQSAPGQATAYMIGQMHIIKLREYAKEKLGKAFNLKDFHLQLLYQGSAPLSFLEESINEYVDCVLNNNKEGCEEILSRLTKDTQDIDNANDDLATMGMLERQLYF